MTKRFLFSCRRMSGRLPWAENFDFIQKSHLKPYSVYFSDSCSIDRSAYVFSCSSNLSFTTTDALKKIFSLDFKSPSIFASHYWLVACTYYMITLMPSPHFRDCATRENNEHRTCLFIFNIYFQKTSLLHTFLAWYTLSSNSNWIHLEKCISCIIKYKGTHT